MHSKRKTHIQIVREKYLNNRQLIQTALELSTEDYQMLLFETGCMFLEDLYPSDLGYETYYETISRHKQFWIWWQAEWKKAESQLLELLNINNFPLNEIVYKTEMQQTAFDIQVHHSFQTHYIKPNEKLLFNT